MDCDKAEAKQPEAIRKRAAMWDVPHPTIDSPVLEMSIVPPVPSELGCADLVARSAPVAGLMVAAQARQRPGQRHQAVAAATSRTWTAVALAALIGPLSVVIYAHLHVDQAQARAEFIVAGLEAIVLLLAATILARAVYRYAATVLEQRAWPAVVPPRDSASLAP